MSTKHSKAAEKFLQDSKMAAWHNETLWMVRAKRDKMSKEVPEWEELRNKACELKLYSNSHLEELLLEFEKNATANGAIVHWAKDADEYCAIVYEILNEHNVHHFIKSKSMLAEECGLNPFLMERGIDVVESDLGERILQLMHLEPSHIVLPAIHIKREQVGELFEKEMGTEKGNFDPTYLTHAARKNLRHLFLNAEAAMTGANFAVASTGDIVVCTNEGNADMGTSYPKLNIAAFGMEKIVPDLDSLGVFTRLLARSATGQPVTTYTSHYRRPREGGEYHIIIVDNGRSSLLSKPDHIKTLNCIRCGACMNTCPVYRRSGGYSYTYFIPGPIGINLGDIVAGLVPLNDGVKVFIGGLEVAVGRVLCTLDDGFGDGGDGGEVHVCHPHGNDIIAFLGQVGSEAGHRAQTIDGGCVLAMAVHDGGEIVLHSKFSFSGKCRFLTVCMGLNLL